MTSTTEPYMISTTGLLRLKKDEFQQMSQIIYAECGINLEEGKKTMLESRLGKRLRALHITSFEKYIDYLTSKEGLEKEMVHMIDVVTTNKTDFFREPHHFDFLTSNILPEFHENSDKTFRVWSAACSSGEEPYTLAMVMQDFAIHHAGFQYEIAASDISTQVLQKAALAVYDPERIVDVPDRMKKRYLLKSRDRINPTVRIAPELRARVNFMHLNLMDREMDIQGNLDIIFCRNVLIYFDRPTQLKVIGNLIHKLKPGGFLFIGHSESLHQFDLPLKQVKPTIFLRK
jgi:chemotaxis protein methyltransferase CheR